MADTGPGITPDDLPHIFERFYRGRAAADYKTPGTGVGLSISREIAAPPLFSPPPLLLYERGVLPDILSFTLGNICLIGGTAYDSWAMYHISQRLVSRALRLSSLIGISVLCLLATPLSAAGRIAAASLLVMIFYALGGHAMLSRPADDVLRRQSAGACG